MRFKGNHLIDPMKCAFLIAIITLSILTATAQIKNPGFEQRNDTLKTMPKYWSADKVAGFNVALDTGLRYSDKAALLVTNVSNTAPRAYQPFAQTVDVLINKPARLTVSAYINTKMAKTYAGLYCEVRDANKKQMGFKNMATDDSLGWKKYRLTLVADSGARQLQLGGFLLGGGKAWFDDFEITYAPMDAPASAAVKAYIDGAKTIIKQNSIFSDKLNWADIDKQTEKLSRGLDDIADAVPITNYLIEQLHIAGDNHSFLHSKQRAAAYATRNDNPVHPKAKLMEGNIGYVSVPAFISTSDTACVNFATTIQKLISDLDASTKVKGWIVDLRGNSGGNLYPMIAGLGALIGDGDLGYFVKPTSNGKNYGAWYLRKGVAGTGDVKSVVITPSRLKRPNVKIAVLVDPGTASSGEMTAISFIGKANAKIIGGKTGGYTTANRGFPLADGSMLYISTGYSADRNKKEYFGSLTPDVLITPPSDDVAVFNAAREWIVGK